MQQFDNDSNRERTILTVQALNRENLLRDITGVLAEMEIHVLKANIVTAGKRAMDIFQVGRLLSIGCQRQPQLRERRVCKRGAEVFLDVYFLLICIFCRFLSGSWY